jgi:hypothetical protein
MDDGMSDNCKTTNTMSAYEGFGRTDVHALPVGKPILVKHRKLGFGIASEDFVLLRREL